jgi:predicted MPP superfamily phosphohydrolase
MKSYQLATFLTIVLTVYSAVNYYIFIRGWQALPGNTMVKSIYTIAFVCLFLSYILSRVIERFGLTELSVTLNWIGSFWLAAMLYFVLFLVFADLMRIFNHFFHFFPSFITSDWQKSKLVYLCGTFVLTLIIITGGFINDMNPRLKTLDITIDKPSKIKKLKILMASDIHIGAIIGYAKVEKLVESINSHKPDIVLFPGDILDEDVSLVRKRMSGEPMKKLVSPLGVYAIPGNHEYIGGYDSASDYIESLGIKILRDKYILIGESFYLVGRDDRSKNQFSGQKRSDLETLITGIDKTLPIIMMDHQPFALEEAVKAGVDLQLSGHTHHGQMWPFNYITNKVYELSWGYLKKGNTQFYVSSGYGSWGPPVRTGNHPELMVLNIHFR